MITVACLTSLVALNGKNHAGTGIPQLFTFTQPLERAQNDAFVHPTFRALVALASTSTFVSKGPAHPPLSGRDGEVKAGQSLAVMESMKMEPTIAAPQDGEVTKLLYAPGDQIAEGAELLKLA